MWLQRREYAATPQSSFGQLAFKANPENAILSSVKAFATFAFLALFAITGEAVEVLWNAFAAEDHDWYQDLKGASAYYYGTVTPEIGFKYNYNTAGTRITSITPALEFMNCGANGLYWVIANYGDELNSSSDFLGKTLLADCGFSDSGVGDDILIPSGGKSFYAACFGDTFEYDDLTKQYHETPFFAWIEIDASRTDGISVGSSGIAIGNGVIVGEYATIPLDIPEPTSGFLLLIGAARLALRRRSFANVSATHKSFPRTQASRFAIVA